MIRAVTLQDTSAITAIYNEYIAHSTSTFDIEPVSEEEMQKRISEISARYPYFAVSYTHLTLPTNSRV